MQRTRYLCIGFVTLLASAGCGTGQIGALEEEFVFEGDAVPELLSSAPIEASAPFARAGLRWDSPNASALEVQFAGDGPEWSEWRPVTVTFVEEAPVDSPREAGGGTEETLWVYAGHVDPPGGLATRFRVRSVDDVELTFAAIEVLADVPELDPEPETGLLDAGAGQSSHELTYGSAYVNPRSAWGARATRCSATTNPYRMTIHHTAGPNNDSMSPQARMRQMQSYHMDSKGWCDLGYHFVVSHDGRLWQGRALPKKGAHVANGNTGNIGVSFMGTFTTRRATNTQLDKTAALLRGLAGRYGISVSRSTIKGHRELGSTVCPGDALYGQLSTLVDRAKSGGGSGGTPCDTRAGIFAWSCRGPIAGKSCTRIRESMDPHTWDDNYFCSDFDLGMRWSSSGPIDSMRCTRIHEGADPHTWDDNYLCVPPDSAYTFSWSSAGKRGSDCIQWTEPADPHTWHDNYLCWERSCTDRNGPFGFSCRGPIGGMHCTQVDEPADPHTWDDNYFCAEEDLGMRWSARGAIDGMACTRVRESADPHTWDDNYLCLPPTSRYELEWHYRVPSGPHCVAWYEPVDPHTWHDNYVCWERSCFDHQGPFSWSCKGAIDGMSCTQILEPLDPDTWDDNYFCAQEDLGIRWSYRGPIDGMRCTHIREPADDDTWDDNYLCVPEDSPYTFSWRSSGNPGPSCIQWSEPFDPDTWNDNYLCWSE